MTSQFLSIRKFETGASYDFEISQKCSKRVKTKIQKVSRANSYVSRSFVGKNSRGTFPHPVQNRVKLHLQHY